MTETRPEAPKRARKTAAQKPPEPEAEAPATPMITTDQMRLMHLLLRDHLGLTERADVIDYLSVVVGREVESRKDLTRDEASTVIEHLEATEPPQPPPKPTVLEAITAVRKDMPAIGRNQRNEDQGYAFRGIDDVMAALGPTMVRHGVGYYPEVEDIERSERPTRSGGLQTQVIARVRWTVYGPAGDFLQAVTYGQGLDTSDKSVNKAATAAEKYMLTQVFAIPTRDYDADQWSPQAEHYTPPPQEQRPAPPTTEALLERLDQYAAEAGIDREAITAKWRHENGDIPVEALASLRPEVVFPLVRQIGEYLAAQRHVEVQAGPAGDGGGYT